MHAHLEQFSRKLEDALLQWPASFQEEVADWVVSLGKRIEDVTKWEMLGKPIGRSGFRYKIFLSLSFSDTVRCEHERAFKCNTCPPVMLRWQPTVLVLDNVERLECKCGVLAVFVTGKKVSEMAEEYNLLENVDAWCQECFTQEMERIALEDGDE